MAGSIVWREYLSDHGEYYQIRVDKSNANLSTFDSGSRLVNQISFNSMPIAPKALKFRRLHCFAKNNRNIKRSFVYGVPQLLTSYSATGGDYLVDESMTDGSLGVPIWIITGYTGERFSLPYRLDTSP